MQAVPKLKGFKSIHAKAEVVFEEETDSDKKIAHTVKVDHRVFRYRASDPEGHRVVCMHNAKQGTVQSGDVLIFDDYEKVFSTFSEGVAVFDPEGSETAVDVFNQCGSSVLITDSATHNGTGIDKAFQRIREIEEEDLSRNGEEVSEAAEEDMQKSLQVLRAAAVEESVEGGEHEECSLILRADEDFEIRYVDVNGLSLIHI